MLLLNMNTKMILRKLIKKVMVVKSMVKRLWLIVKEEELLKCGDRKDQEVAKARVENYKEKKLNYLINYRRKYSSLEKVGQGPGQGTKRSNLNQKIILRSLSLRTKKIKKIKRTKRTKRTRKIKRKESLTLMTKVSQKIKIKLIKNLNIIIIKKIIIKIFINKRIFSIINMIKKLILVIVIKRILKILLILIQTWIKIFNKEI